ncbi:uncharacterized protein F4807DRAFT_454228 [Annulohypoxylon truncatum]|uniref:uncharacterized protein n=1 Tax=Annulohypoxylon truncatum TaxID=327061 RepID=UPI002008BD7C|nr:uncharacterized protein F4807DRAFT_454228 [Annulohypoxylon truncatum]KAI1205102.1 hypothetical protein F4807DRAFT_454228 [Annulohypoxylon truncatum]
MLTPFYRRFNSKRLTKESRVESRYSTYLKNIKIFKTRIPLRLSFEEIVRNKAYSPCSLNDFMDYLVYVEHGAENLQFFLWFCGYVERWSQLPESEKERSPVWGVGRRTNVRPNTRSERLGESADKLSRILAILDRGTTTIERTTSVKELESKGDHVDKNFSRPRTPATGVEMKQGDRNDWQWQPFSAQPFRYEATKVARHYISTSGPRKLNLTYQDRTSCMHALQHTTHPSAFLPAFLAAETTLRGYSHPKFIRWSIRNSNGSRMLFSRVLGVCLIGLGVMLDVILILSKFQRLARLSAVPFWYIGLYVLLIEGRGISIRLYLNRKRHLRPWEQVETTDPENKAPNSTDTYSNRQQDTARVDPPIKASMQPLGSANNFGGEPWVISYRGKSFWQKVFDVSVANRNRHVRSLQDRAVFTSLLWASFLVMILAVGSVLIPPGNLF